MDYGVVMFPTEYSMAPDELGRALEERGFESLWFPEHTHIPASRQSPWPGGGDLPREYWSAYDPFVALMAAAGATRRLKLGTGICLVIERDPITTAKEVATLDRLSGGRVLFGIGGGWNAEEMENHGTAWKTRWKVLRERVLAMKAIWTQREASYRGDHVRFLPLAWLLVQTGHVSADVDTSLITASRIVHNLVPVTLGNIVGGAGFVGAIYWTIYRITFGAKSSDQ